MTMFALFMLAGLATPDPPPIVVADPPPIVLAEKLTVAPTPAVVVSPRPFPGQSSMPVTTVRYAVAPSTFKAAVGQCEGVTLTPARWATRGGIRFG